MRVGAHYITALALGLLLVCATGSVAQSQDRWATLVLGNPTQGAERAFADSFHAADSFKKNPALEVTLHRELGPEQILAALQELQGQDQVMLYFAGALDQRTGASILVAQDVADPRLALSTIIANLAAGGTKRLTILLENCAGRAGGTNPALPTIDAPAGVEFLFAASTNVANACAAGSERLSDVLATVFSGAADGDLASLLTQRGLWVETSQGVGGFTFNTANAAPAAENGDDVLFLDLPTTQAVAPAPVQELIVITAPIETVTARATQVITTAAISTTISQAPASQSTGQNTGPAIFVPPPISQQASVPVAAGLPEPSIIIGLLEVTNASFEVVPDDLGTVTSNEVSFDNLDARLAMRTSDPELFATLVSSGAFDPPAPQLAAALQTELKRMSCYLGRIDGDWGRGSRSSVDKYFSEAGGSPETREATHVLFRQIILNEDVTCPVPVAAPVRSTPRNTSSSSGGGSAAPRAPAPAPAPAPAAPTLNTNAIGVFR